EEVHNECIVYSRFRFQYQTYEEPRLHELRRKYRLDEVTAQATDEFGALVRLRNWTRSRFRRRDYQPFMKNFDALEVLDRNLRNDAGAPSDHTKYYDPCHFFPLLYCQVLLSKGYQARLTNISQRVAHGMAEVWSNQYKKWIAMDVELNHHFEKDGIPLNMLEVHNELFEDKPSRVRVVRGEQTSGDPSPAVAALGREVTVEGMISYHRDLEIIAMRNDWMTK